MSRPLLITDCDEVLLHMVGHFAEWLEADHGVNFALESGGFTDAMTVASTGEPITMEYLGSRLNLSLNERDVVIGASCG